MIRKHKHVRRQKTTGRHEIVICSGRNVFKMEQDMKGQAGDKIECQAEVTFVRRFLRLASLDVQHDVHVVHAGEGNSDNNQRNDVNMA